MARKKSTNKKSRQQAGSPLPLKTSEKTAAYTKKPEATPKKKTKTRSVVKSSRKTTKKPKGIPRNKKVIVRQFRIPLGPKVHLLIQLKPTKAGRKKVSRRTSLFAKFIPLYARIKRMPSAIPLIILGLAGTLYFSMNILRPPALLTVYSPSVPTPVIHRAVPMAELKSVTLHKSDPVSLQIPDIGVSTSLTSVGRKADNTLEVPKSAGTPGWYRDSPTPGELGPSVIVGHVDSPKGPAIFWRLRELLPGQIIEVTRVDGTIARFEVKEVRQFEQDSFPTAEVYGNIDHGGLRLITCGGTYNRIAREYSHNTVVFASLLL